MAEESLDTEETPLTGKDTYFETNIHSIGEM
jgi:hypothetical protein